MSLDTAHTSVCATALPLPTGLIIRKRLPSGEMSNNRLFDAPMYGVKSNSGSGLPKVKLAPAGTGTAVNRFAALRKNSSRPDHAHNGLDPPSGEICHRPLSTAGNSRT